MVGFLAAVLAVAHVDGQRPAVWRLDPDIRIGADERGPQAEFTRIVAVLPAPNGSVAIADADAREIRIFGPTGEYKHKVGRDGAGPGEFRTLSAAGLLGDTLWVVDGIQQRSTFFSLDGKLLTTSSAKSTTVALYGLLAGGFAYGWTGSEFRPQPSTPVVLTKRSAEVVDTLASVASANARVLIATDGGFIFGRQVFSDACLTVATPDGRLLYIVDRLVAKQANSAAFRVLALEPDGDTLWNRAFSYVPRPFDKARGDSLLNTMIGRSRRTGVTPEQIRRAVFIPDYYTPVTGAIVSSDSSLWLRREEGVTVDYSVLDARGHIIANLTVPARVTLMAVTKTNAWGIEKDEFDVPTVVRYRIDR